MILSYLYCQQPVLQVIHQALVVILSSSQSPGCRNEEHEHRLHSFVLRLLLSFSSGRHNFSLVVSLTPLLTVSARRGD